MSRLSVSLSNFHGPGAMHFSRTKGGTMSGHFPETGSWAGSPKHLFGVVAGRARRLNAGRPQSLSRLALHHVPIGVRPIDPASDSISGLLRFPVPSPGAVGLKAINPPSRRVGTGPPGSGHRRPPHLTALKHRRHHPQQVVRGGRHRDLPSLRIAVLYPLEVGPNDRRAPDPLCRPQNRSKRAS